MEIAKRIMHKEGMDTDPVAALCDADLPDAHLPREQAKDEEKLSWEQQAGPEHHASTDLGSGVAEHGDGVSEDAVTSGLGYHRSEGDEPDNHGDEEKTKVRIHNNNSTTSSAEASILLHEHRNYPAAGLKASDMSRDGRTSAIGYSQGQDKGITSNDNANSSPEEEQQSSDPDTAKAAVVVDSVGVNGEDRFDETSTTGDSWREDEAPPLDLNYEALRHIASTYLSHGSCVDITTLRRGGFHEIRVLHFEDGWSCIARFTRNYEMLCKTESELASIEYVRKHTSIPVPQIYFVNHNENHVVGAPFVLMQRLEGQALCEIWTELTLEHKKSVICQLAHVLGQLAELKFDSIGSLKADGTLGPLLNITEPENAMGETSFQSSIDYFCAFLRENNSARTSAARKHYPAIQEELKSFMGENAGNPTLDAPYRLIHNDLDSQNILITQEDKTLPPRISGIIDWDWSYTGPLYYLCEYPHDICDWDDAPENYADNKILRKHLVATLIDHFPENSPERNHIKQCFREKSYILNYFQSLFITRVWPKSMEGALIEQYLKKVRGAGSAWERLPYSGRFDWERDSDLSDSDLEDGEVQSDDESVCDDDEDSGDDNFEEPSLESVEEADGSLSVNTDENSIDTINGA